MTEPKAGAPKVANTGGAVDVGTSAVTESPGERKPVWLHEWTTTVFAGAIAGAALYMLLGTYGAAHSTPHDAAAFDRQKDIMLYGLSLLGAVIGYYFGRVPAERRAENAEKTASNAQKSAADANLAANQAQISATAASAKRDVAQGKVDRAREVLVRVDEVIRGLAARPVARLESPGPSPDPALVHASAQVEELLRTLN